MNTKISYMYRDGSNYKTYSEVILEGELTRKQLEDIQSKMEFGDGFVPHQVGLRGLQENLQCFDTQDWDDDHQLHELDIDNDVSFTEAKPTQGMTAEEFYQLFMKVKSWDACPTGHILTGDLNIEGEHPCE